MSLRHRYTSYAVAAWLFCVAAQTGPAVGQQLHTGIGLTSSAGELLGGQSTSPASSTTVVSQGQVFLDDAPTTATTRVGFNINADAEPGLVAIEVGIASFDVRVTLDHSASFDLTFDFLLRGQVLRVQDQECLGSITLADVTIPTVVRLRDGAEFPLDVLLPGVTLDLDDNTTGVKLSEQDSRTLQFRGEPVETTAYRLTFIASVTAISQSCEVSARFGADNGSTTGCSACEYPGFEDRTRDEDGLFVSFTVTTLCGNGALDPGEQCDQGEQTGTDDSCCDGLCRFAPSNEICRPAVSDCDQVENCSGQSGICPEDSLKVQGAACTADSSLCTEDVCDARGACVHPVRAGTSCDGDNGCTCDSDGLFCTGPVRCAAGGGGLCIQLPAPCGEDDICDEERDLCVSPFATPTSTPNGSATVTPTATTSAAICAGDCNGNGAVTVNELVFGVNIALSSQSASACAAFDIDGDGRIAVNELVAGVNNTLRGCPT